MGVKLFTIIYQTHKNGDNEYKNHIQNILFFELNLFSTNRLEFNATKHAHTHHQTIGHSTNTITSTVNVKTGGKTRSPASARGPEPKQPSRTYPFPNTARTIFTTNRTSRRLSHQQTPLTTNRTQRTKTLDGDAWSCSLRGAWRKKGNNKPQQEDSVQGMRKQIS